MSANRSKDTRPELLVRSVLRQLRVGYRVHDARLPGSPDVSMRGRKAAIFVHGCFWHSHSCRPPRRATSSGTP
jgi:DNA mismatch endonuclease (patch repair protein)